MKFIIIVCDGMADYPIAKLNGQTPMMFAQTPFMDKLAKEGITGLFKTVPDELNPGSEVANLSIMGYNPLVDFCQRGVLEAASLGVELKNGQIAMRCNFIYAKNNKMISHSGGDISDEEATKYIKKLNNAFSEKYNVKFYQGKHYRHLLVLENGDQRINCYPPHDHIEKTLSELQITALHIDAEKTANVLNTMITESNNIFANSDEKRCPNYIWPWAAGEKPKFKTLKERTGLKGAVISAVDLIKGLGIYAGMDVINVEGATGTSTTNYEGKALAAIKALEKYNYIFLHIEAADEAGHDGDIDLKVKVLEDIDSRLISKIVNAACKSSEKIRIAVLPDHPTPVETRLHVKGSVPVLISGHGITPDTVNIFNEDSVKQGSLGIFSSTEWEKLLGIYD